MKRERTMVRLGEEFSGHQEGSYIIMGPFYGDFWMSLAPAQFHRPQSDAMQSPRRLSRCVVFWRCRRQNTRSMEREREIMCVWRSSSRHQYVSRKESLFLDAGREMAEKDRSNKRKKLGSLCAGAQKSTL